MRDARLFLALVVALAATAVVPRAAHAERLPLTTFTVRDGLHDDNVRRIVRDRAGRLWFAHRSGLSRLDGQRFETYGPAQGLPRARVRDVLHTRDGLLLVATQDGFFRFNPGATPAVFVRVGGDLGQDAHALAEDAGGDVWGGTAAGLCRFAGRGAEFACRPAVPALAEPVLHLAALRGGGLVAASRLRIALLAAGDLPAARVTAWPAVPRDVLSLAAGTDGTLAWIGTTTGLKRLLPDARVEPVALDGAAGDAPPWVLDILADEPGVVWLAMNRGLVRIDGAALARAARVTRFTTANGLSQDEIAALARDADGNLWLGSESAGAMRLARNGLVSWSDEEGLGDPRIASIFETRDGRLHASAGARLYRHDGARFVEAPVGLSREDLGWGWYQWLFEDRAGTWWIPSRHGVRRVRGPLPIERLAAAPPEEVLVHGLVEDAGSVFRLHEDARGDVWIGTIGGVPRCRISHWDRATGRLRHLTAEEGVPAVSPTAFREDRAGATWIGFFDGGVGRWRDGRMTFYAAGERGVPRGQVRALHLDARGRLWIATEGGGVARIDDPSAGEPRFVTLTTADGLSSDLVASIAEDLRGRLYFGTDVGIDRFDPTTRALRYYGLADGLPNRFVNVAYRDRAGVLWFGTLHGIARLEPVEDDHAPVPAALIRRVRVAGVPWPVSGFGAAELPHATFARGADRVLIDFDALGPGRAGIRFQYRIDGRGAGRGAPWSEPSSQTSVEFAALAPGTYAFAVRAVDEAGRAGAVPARFAFTVRAPFWRTGWFLALCAAPLAVVAYGIHRARLSRAVELERIRTRIASDLHDDIGATLSRMALLLDAAQRRTGAADSELHAALGRIATSAREAVDSMGDIVWAVNPRRDRLGDLVQRMRTFATAAFDAAGVEFEFSGPADGTPRLGPDVRRDVLLLFKESVNNTLRHARCRRVEARLEIEGARLELRVRDDGRGFDPAARSAGNGLASMRRRAEGRGGSMTLATSAGEGTVLTFSIPT